MPAAGAFQVNTPHVIFENIEGELVLIHMARGSYYSTDEIGAQLWDLIVAGHPVEEMKEWIGASYQGDATEIARGIGDFLQELTREELIVPATSSTNGRPHPAAVTERAPFQPPVLNKYRDMEDMLMLDPIHEVEEAGWPAPKPPETVKPSESKSG
jgi:hypothetical protein